MSWPFTKHRVKEVDPVETNRQLEAGAAVVVDVRELHELREGSIPGSRHIPLGQLQAHVGELLAAPEVIFVCRSGARSAAATTALTRAGHPNAFNMAGGMIAWKHKGLPVER
jgi:rhodanese-related sulfurtransferase